MSEGIEGLIEADMALDGLIAALSPAGRRRLGLRLGQLARKENARRMAANVAPEGAAFAPRLRQRGPGAKRGRMFRKLRAARMMQVRLGAEEVTVQFAAGAGRVAAVHHFGLRDKVTEKGPVRQYAARPLLGFSKADLEALEERAYEHLAQALR